MAELEWTLDEHGVGHWAAEAVAPPSGSSTVRLIKKPFTLHDFTVWSGTPDDPAKTATLLALTAGDVLLGSMLAVTEAFDDGGSGDFDIQTTAGGLSLTPATITATVVPAPVDGLTKLVGGTVDWRSVTSPYAVGVGGATLVVAVTSWENNGTTGRAVAYFFIATPVAA